MYMYIHVGRHVVLRHYIYIALHTYTYIIICMYCLKACRPSHHHNGSMATGEPGHNHV